MSKAVEAVKAEKKVFNYKYQRDKDREMVRGKFIFHEVPGGGMSFNIKLYKEDQVERYDLHDGQIYTLPLGVARHLNKNGWYPVYDYMKDEQTQNVQRIGQKVRRFSFQSLEFVDVDDLTPEGKGIITVENVG
jgi:hypothetical protein